MSRRSAELLLFGVIAARSTGYLFSKIALGAMGPYTLMSLRFLLGFVVLLVIFHKKLKGLDKRTLLHGMILGFLFFLTMSCELTGLLFVPTSTMGFLENTAIILVPLFSAVLLRKLPGRKALICSGIAVAGVAFLTLKGGHLGLSVGELICLGAATFYAFTIIATDRFSKKDDATVLGILQIGFIGIFGTIAAFIVEEPALPTSAPVWGSMLFLVLVCTVFGFTFQPVAQKYTSAETAGLFCAFNPLIAGTLGIIVLHEAFGLSTFIGGALILSSIVISKLGEGEKHIERNRAPAGLNAECAENAGKI